MPHPGPSPEAPPPAGASPADPGAAFPRELARVIAVIRRRSALRFAAWGFALGVCLAAGLSLAILTAAISRSETPAPLPASSIWLPWAAAAAFALAAAMIGYTRRVTDADAASWADAALTKTSNADTVSTALTATGPFAAPIHHAAAVSARQAAAQPLRIPGISRPIALALALAALCGTSQIINATVRQPRADPGEMPSPLTMLVPVIGAAAGLAGFEGVEKLAKEVDLPALAQAATDAGRLGQLLQDGKLTQAQALAEANRVIASLESSLGNPADREALQVMLGNATAKKLADELRRNAKPGSTGTPSTPDEVQKAVASSATVNADLAAIAKTLGWDGIAPGGMESALARLGGLAGRSELARRVLDGAVDTPRAVLTLKVGGDLSNRTELARRAVTGEPGAREALAAAPAPANDVLLRDLAALPRSEIPLPSNTPGAGNNASANAPRVQTTGRELEASGADYQSRSHRLPTDVRDPASRYFGGK